MTPLRICYATSEVTPLAKVGGLADVSAALCTYLHQQGHDIRLFVPRYGHIALDDLQPLPFLQHQPIEIGSRLLRFSVYTRFLPKTDLPIYLIDCPPLYDRAHIYTDDDDEAHRFIFLNRAIIKCLQKMEFSPHIIHANDWQTALLPLYLKTRYAWESLFNDTYTVFGIHNLGYQGRFSSKIIEEAGLSEFIGWFHQDDLRQGEVNLMKTGLLHADQLVTVSPTYAQEICTPEHGMGLQALLNERRHTLIGILNGVDYREWHPAHDPCLPHPYDADSLPQKQANKQQLCRDLGLNIQPERPLIAMISRLTHQKGFDLLQTMLPTWLRAGQMQFVVLGQGDSAIEAFLQHMSWQFPQGLAFYNGFDAELAHRIEGGADFFLMPSRYEPCGLNQMYSLRYGTLPIVRRTGGLADTVQPIDIERDFGTGIVFENYDAPGLHWALTQALALYTQAPDAYHRAQQRAMAQDFSWEQQGALYEQCYRLLGKTTA